MTIHFSKSQSCAKRFFLLAALLLFSFTVTAQSSNESNARTEQALSEIQIGSFGIWYAYELGLTPAISLRTEVGLEAAYIRFGNGVSLPNEYYSFQEDYAIVPELNLIPRWYYNFSKRQDKSKITANNSANFLALKLSYSPSLFAITSTKNPGPINQIELIPKWGIRRALNQHFNYELGIGMGYRHQFFKKEVFYYKANNTQNYVFYNHANQDDFIVELHFHISYTF